MSKNIYISCDPEERNLEQVKSLCTFLQESSHLLNFAPLPKEGFLYPKVEYKIERCDVFVAIIGAGYGYDCSTWLNHELLYASILRRHRMISRPRMFGLCIENYKLPRCSETIELEYLSESDYSAILNV